MSDPLMSLKKQQGKRPPLLLPEMRSAAATPRIHDPTCASTSASTDVAREAGVASSLSTSFNAGYPQPTQPHQHHPLLSHRKTTGASQMSDRDLGKLKPFVLKSVEFYLLTDTRPLLLISRLLICFSQISSSRVPYKNKSKLANPSLYHCMCVVL